MQSVESLLYEEKKKKKKKKKKRKKEREREGGNGISFIRFLGGWERD